MTFWNDLLGEIKGFRFEQDLKALGKPIKPRGPNLPLDGDGDGFVVDPITGEDNVPFVPDVVPGSISIRKNHKPAPEMVDKWKKDLEDMTPVWAEDPIKATDGTYYDDKWADETVYKLSENPDGSTLSKYDLDGIKAHYKKEVDDHKRRDPEFKSNSELAESQAALDEVQKMIDDKPQTDKRTPDQKLTALFFQTRKDKTGPPEKQVRTRENDRQIQQDADNIKFLQEQLKRFEKDPEKTKLINESISHLQEFKKKK